jgi:hypothetical protein
MSAKITTKQREMAAQMVAEDEYPDAGIASRVGISERTLERWKLQPAFRERVARLVHVYAERALKHGLARQERRLSVLNDLHGKLLQIIRERSEDGELEGVPGAATGLICKTVKGIGKGGDYQVVDVYEVDNPTVREIRALQEQAAEEVGQRVTRLSADVTAAITHVSLENLNDKELELLQQLVEKITPDASGDSGGDDTAE